MKLDIAIEEANSLNEIKEKINKWNKDDSIEIGELLITYKDYIIQSTLENAKTENYLKLVVTVQDWLDLDKTTTFYCANINDLESKLKKCILR